MTDQNPQNTNPENIEEALEAIIEETNTSPA